MASFGPSWQELGRATLVDGVKDAHDLLAAGSKILALDNVVFPVYVLVVDIGEDHDPKVSARGRIEGIHPHLEAQFIDPDTEIWGVIQSFAHRGGTGKLLRVLSPQSASQVDKPSLLSIRPQFGPGSRKSKDRTVGGADEVTLWPPSEIRPGDSIGIELHMRSAPLPTWVVATALNDEPPREMHSLYRLGTRSGRVVLDHRVPLWEEETRRRFALWTNDDWVFVFSQFEPGAANNRDSRLRLTIVDPADLTVVYDSPLPSQVQELGNLRSVYPWPSPYEEPAASTPS